MFSNKAVSLPYACVHVCVVGASLGSQCAQPSCGSALLLKPAEILG